jgi:hypothetical protein
MRHLLCVFGMVLILNVTAFTQCSVLTVTGTLNPGETITIAVTGAAGNAPAFLAAGRSPGTTAFDFGFLGGFTLDLDQPFLILPLGVTNGSGDVSFTTTVSSNLPPGAIGDETFVLQAVTAEFQFGLPPSLDFCVSNTATLRSGDGGSLAAILKWNHVVIDMSGVDHMPSNQGPPHTFGQQVGPCRAARAMAIIHIAMFETLIAIDGGHQSYVGLPAVAGPHSRAAAIAQAAHDTAVGLYPSQSAECDAKLAAELALIPGGAAKTNGVALGSAAAAAILAMRANDGSNHPEPLVNVDYIPSQNPGFWRQDPISLHPLALGANWSTVLPFVMTSASQFRAPAPPPMSSAAYAAAYAEVKAVGGDGQGTATIRTEEQTQIGIYWAYDGTPSLCAPPRLYNQIATLIGKNEDLDGHEMGRLLALVNVAMADAGLAIWESKFFHAFWRPVTGIRESDPGTGPTLIGDGNPATVGDTGWSPFGAPASNVLNGINFTPPFPAYPSGHAGFGGSLFQTMRRVFGTDDIPFTFVSDEFNGVTLDGNGDPRPLIPRSFADFTQAEEENGQSRIYLGIHWSFDKTEGIAQGNDVADWVFDHIFQPVP